MKRDAVAGAGLAVLGAVALAGAPPRDPVAGVMGPGVLPSLVALGLVATGLGLMAATLRPRAMRRRTGGRGGAGLAEPGVPAQAGPGPSRGALAAGSQSVPVDPAPAQADPGPPREGAGPAGKEADDSPRQGRIPLLVTAAATTAYLVALPRLGFPLASGLFMAGLSWYLGERRLSVAILWGGLFAAALWAGFVRGLGVPLPVGPLGRP